VLRSARSLRGRVLHSRGRPRGGDGEPRRRYSGASRGGDEEFLSAGEPGSLERHPPRGSRAGDLRGRERCGGHGRSLLGGEPGADPGDRLRREGLRRGDSAGRGVQAPV